jgi:hypothetical protein
MLSTISRLMMANKNGAYLTKMGDIFEAATSISGLEITHLPEDMKLSLIDNLLEAKAILANEVFAYHTEIEFDVNDDTVEVMREVVKTALIG